MQSFSDEKIMVLILFCKNLATRPNWQTWRSIAELETVWQLFAEQIANVSDYYLNIQRTFSENVLQVVPNLLQTVHLIPQLTAK